MPADASLERRVSGDLLDLPVQRQEPIVGPAVDALVQVPVDPRGFWAGRARASIRPELLTKAGIR